MSKTHYDKAARECQYCYSSTDKFPVTWSQCAQSSCTKRVHACDLCKSRSRDNGLLCQSCWKAAGSLCLKCKKEKARTERCYLHMCRSCIPALEEAIHFDKVAEESRRYLEVTRQTLEWDEPAFQFLVLPDLDARDLPEYDARPISLSPQHCRLCLTQLGNSTLENHLESHHDGKTVTEYRREILGRTLVQWPQPVTAQLLRTRLAAFRKELSDQNFLLLSCAVCARQKRRCKLFDVSFPPPNATHAPAWLSWSKVDWDTHGATWYEQVDTVLNIT